MSEPKSQAGKVEEVLPGVWHWWVRDDRIGGGRSEAFALVDGESVVLVDPLPIAEQTLRGLGEVEAIILTAGNHQRSAWRFRRVFGAPVYAPVDAYGLEEEPDHSYSGGDLLPGHLAAFHTPGPVESMHALWRSEGLGLVFLSDLLVRTRQGITFISSEWQDEPWRTRESVRRIAENLPVDVLLLAHGEPVLSDGRRVLEKALEEDDERPSPGGH